MRLSALSLLVACSAALPGRAAEPIHQAQRDAAGRLIGAALLSDVAHDRLGILCDRIGHRLSGSPQLEEAIRWSLAEMRADGLERVRAEPVKVPVWVRGEESARLIAPVERPLDILGLGGSVGTPPGGLTAQVAVVSSFDELDALGEAVRGKIVLYDVPFTTYGQTVQYRVNGASRAAAHGAVASLVRSVGPASLQTPHTGVMRYADDLPRIPTAAVTIEDATMMHRMADRGERLRLHLEMGARTLPDAPSANVVAEIRGRELPDEIVVVGGHLDSWDVGQGAQDDGAGCLIAWEAARLPLALGMQPRRTIRVVLFTNEENGLAGGRAYAERHRDEMHRHVAVLESDSGNGPARGFRLQVPPAPGDGEAAETTMEAWTKSATGVLDEIAPLLEPLGAAAITPGGAGADVGPSVAQGVPGLGLDHDTTRYFEIHHTRADTFEKIDRRDLNRNVAVMAVMAWALADMPGRLIDPQRVADATAER